MNRIFGKKKEAPPPPSMTEAAGRVDGRVGALDAKVNPVTMLQYINGGDQLGSNLSMYWRKDFFLKPKNAFLECM